MDTMIDLSIAAHARATKYGAVPPCAREDLRSYAMRWFHGTPVFDETRLRDDQSDDVMAVLRRLSGRVATRKVRAKVQDWMEAYGGTGVRLDDVVEALGSDKRLTRKYLNEMAAAGKVDIREEPNPRKGGTPRKRYYWVARTDTADLNSAFSEDIYEDFGVAGTGGILFGQARVNSDIGVIHHGSACGALQGCLCGRCLGALEEGYFGQMVSEARQAGGSGFAEGVELMTLRRKAQEYRESRRNG